jgi:hypothetical protein
MVRLIGGQQWKCCRVSAAHCQWQAGPPELFAVAVVVVGSIFSWMAKLLSGELDGRT